MTTPASPKPAIEDLQQLLNEFGYTDASGNPLVVDGVWGAKTQHALDQAYADMGWNDHVGTESITESGFSKLATLHAPPGPQGEEGDRGKKGAKGDPGEPGIDGADAPVPSGLTGQLRNATLIYST